MKLELLNAPALARAYETDLTEAFPPEELKPLAAMEALRRKGCYDPLCLRDGEEVLGYILLWRHPAAPYFLIDYLCVPAARRNGGIGAKLLEAAFAHYPPETVFLGESEAPTGDSERDGMIRRRLGFYARMGAKTLSYDCALFGVHFKTIAWCRAGLPRERSCCGGTRRSTVPGCARRSTGSISSFRWPPGSRFAPWRPGTNETEGGPARDMLILSVESTCDETAVAVTRNGREVLTDQIFSQADLHAVYGGVVPEIASRSHVEGISQLADRALQEAGVSRGELDAVAVSYAPGLIGAVLVGVSFAKSVAFGLGIPLIPVHHIRGHIAANYIAYPELEPPFVCLAISGGNTLLVDVRGYTDMRVLGCTRTTRRGSALTRPLGSWAWAIPGASRGPALPGGDDKRYPLPVAMWKGTPTISASPGSRPR